MIHRRTIRLEKIEQEYISLRNSAKEFSLQLENKNKELLEKQDYEIHLATLNERNRIARDIHDNIGHLLSNSLLQTGALMATCKDQALYQKLETLKNTLSQGMNSIRESIHDLHDESIDLYTEAADLVKNFQFCEISLDYDIESNPANNVKYALLTVLKEALSNISKHSNATGAKVTLREHPALYQLIIKDNGTKKGNASEGIGLKSIVQRVNALQGIVNISDGNGFTVFISLRGESSMNIVITDDDQLVCLSLKTIIESDGEITVAGVGHSGQEAIHLYQHLQPDILLIDIRMDSMTGLEAAEIIMKKHPEAKIIFLTTFADDEYIIQALKIGAKGYILKQDFERIIPSLKAVFAGQSVFGEDIITKIPAFIQAGSGPDLSGFDLSPKEKEIIELIAEGLNNKEIAQRLFLSEGTIRNSISVILEKLHLRGRTQIAVFYYKSKRFPKS